MLQQGVAARVAMQLLGHSQISMTMHYTHVVPELNAEAAARMNDALWGDAETGSDCVRLKMAPKWHHSPSW
jgi:hypothetical protein